MNEAIDRRCVVYEGDPFRNPPVYKGSMEECLNWCEENWNSYERLVVYQPAVAFERHRELQRSVTSVTRTMLIGDDEVVEDPPKCKYTRRKKVKRGKH